MSFHHSDLIPISFHHSEVILVILMSFHSFWVVWDDLGMTLFRNDENDLGMPISLIPGSFWSSCAIPDDREKMAFFHSHPCHSDVIPSFEHHSEIMNQLKRGRNDGWFEAEVDKVPYWHHQLYIKKVSLSKSEFARSWRRSSTRSLLDHGWWPVHPCSELSNAVGPRLILTFLFWLDPQFHL